MGGCNGCLNLDNISNNGLEDAVSKIEQFYSENNIGQENISRADIWSLAAVLAVQAGYFNQENT